MAIISEINPETAPASIQKILPTIWPRVTR